MLYFKPWKGFLKCHRHISSESSGQDGYTILKGDQAWYTDRIREDEFWRVLSAKINPKQ
jgi:hypothetical protein